jgi:hypothetical protein
MKTIQIRTKSTGLYFIADKGFVGVKRDSATKFDDTAAVRAAFRFQYDGELEFIGEGQYADGAASLPTAPLTQAEIDADLAEKRNWLPFPMALA